MRKCILYEYHTCEMLVIPLEFQIDFCLGTQSDDWLGILIQPLGCLEGIHCELDFLNQLDCQLEFLNDDFLDFHCH